MSLPIPSSASLTRMRPRLPRKSMPDPSPDEDVTYACAAPPQWIVVQVVS